MFASMLKKLFGQKKTSKSVQKRWTYVPGLEGLDQRLLPSVSSPSAGVLNVQGTTGADIITIKDNGHGTITVIDNGQQSQFSGINTVSVSTLEGADTVKYSLTDEFNLGSSSASERVPFNLGNDNDKFTADLPNDLVVG